jgi:tetratricopeptide (TPR) repeat protein
VGVVKPWMEVPSGFNVRPDGKVTCTTLRPHSEIPFRASCLVFAATIAFGHVWHRRTSDRKAALAAAVLTVQLFFPSIVMAREPALSARANWLHIQHENLTWLGGDLFTNLEYSRASWKDQVYLVDTPRQINVVRMPSSGLGAFQFGRLSTWFETLGYSNRFCQFVKPGWIAALFGMTLLVLGECLPGGRLARRRVCLAMTAATATFLTGVLLVAIPVVIAAQELERARESTALGLYDAAEKYLDRAVEALPSLREDTFYIAQKGLLDFRMGREDTPAGRLFHANLLERQGRYARAILEYEALVLESPNGSAVHREALRAILREGAMALNAGRSDNAINWLEQVLREDPCNLKANYALQLAYLRTGRRVDLERLVRQIEATYVYFQIPTKTIVLASSHENEMFAALRERDMNATFRYAVRAKNP